MGGDGVEEEVGGDDVDEEEDVEIIEETEVVEGDTEGIDIEDHEEYVEVFDDEDEEYEEVEDSILEDTIKKIVSDAQTSQAPQITDEKEHDEFAWGRYPVVDKRRLTEATEEQDEEAPMDEMQYLRQQSAGDSPFDEETSEPLPVFQALDEDEEASVRTPVTQVPDEDEEASRELPIFQALEVEEQEQEESETRIPEAEITATNHPSKSQVSVTSDIETGAVPSRSSRSGGLPKDFDDEGKRRWRFIICCLLLVGACAITALVLPFVLDYNEDKDLSRVTPSPTISPAPTMEPSGSPTLLPTISPAPTRSPSVRPSTSPTLSRAPTNIPTASPTRTPTIPATPAPITPTTAPISPTRVPVTPTSAPAAPSTQSPTTLRLGNLISVFLVPLSGEEVFTDQSSPQFQAARYIADDDDFSSELTGEITLAERYALITLYFAAGGENWNQCNLGDTSCAGPWLTGDACDWTFITCNQDGRVSTINFGGKYRKRLRQPRYTLFDDDVFLTVRLFASIPLRRRDTGRLEWFHSSRNFHTSSFGRFEHCERVYKWNYTRRPLHFG